MVGHRSRRSRAVEAGGCDPQPIASNGEIASASRIFMRSVGYHLRGEPAVQRHPQIFWRHQRAARRQLRRGRRQRARAGRRERRRQVHAAEDPGRPRRARRRRDPLARPAPRSREPPAGHRARHRHGLPGDAVLSEPDRVGQHLRGPRDLPLRHGSTRPRCARARRRCSIGCRCASIRTPPPNTSRPRIASCCRWHGRWHSNARSWCSTSPPPRSPTRRPITCSTCCASCSAAARRSSTCRIACRKCSGCAIASPCCATATGRHLRTRRRRARRHRPRHGGTRSPRPIRRRTKRASIGRDRCGGGPLAVCRSATSLAPPHFRNISLDVARGEIVGLFGLVGSGRIGIARDDLRPAPPRIRPHPDRRRSRAVRLGA